MENRNSKNIINLRRILRLRRIWIIVGLGVLAALILISMPFGLDYEIERYFLAHGADQADLEDVDFNPFTRRLVLKNLIVKKGNQQFLSVSEAGFTLSLSPFFRKRFLLKKAEFNNSTITMEELPDGNWQIAGIAVASSGDKANGSAWGFGLVELQVKNSLLKFRGMQLEPASELQIEQARLTRFRSWRPDQKARIEFKGRLNDGKLQFQGDFSPFGSDTTVKGSIKLNGLTLTPFAQLMAADPSTLQGRLDADVRIQGQYSHEIGFNFDQSGRLTLKQIRMRFGNVNLADKDLIWDGSVQVKLPNASDALQLTAAGQLEGQSGSVNPAAENLYFQHGGLNWNGKFTLTRKTEASDLKFDGALKLQDFKMATSDIDLAHESLIWNGSVQIFLPENGETQRLTTSGKLESRRQTIAFPRENLNLANGNLLWTGQFNCGLKDFNAGFVSEGDFSLTDLAITATHKKLRLLASKAVKLQSINGNAGSQFSIARTKITGLKLMGEAGSPEKASLFSAAEVTVDTLNLERLKRISIESVSIADARGRLLHKSNGRWLYLDDLTTFLTDSGSNTQKNQSQKSVAEEARLPVKEDDDEFGIRIASLQIVGDSVLHFEDETVSPTFRTDVRLKKARVTDVNSEKSDQASPMTLEAESRKYTHLKLQGNVQPFASRISMDLKGKIKALEMPPLSPYAVKTIGYNLISGEMDADIDLKIIAGRLEGEGDLKFYDPKIAAVDPEKLKNKEGLPIPLESALKVLRDEKNDVRLKVPISGDINEPKFSFTDAINQAVTKGLSTATLSYLKYMLGPYGVAIGIVELGAKIGAKALTGIRLKPIEFQSGSSDLDAAAQEYVDKVVAILKEKKDMRLRLCGWATESDRMRRREAAGIPTAPTGTAPLAGKSEPDGEMDTPKAARFAISDEKMLGLAQQRADRIEELLVNRHGIKNKRIFVCKPEIDKSPEATPRVELVF